MIPFVLLSILSITAAFTSTPRYLSNSKATPFGLDRRLVGGDVTADRTALNMWDLFGKGSKDDEAEEVMVEVVGVPVPDSKTKGSNGRNSKSDIDVLVVGAGAAGIGTAIMLTQTFGLDTSRVMIVERGDDAGESFRQWPKEMKFISPSFNQQGWTESFDLNAVSYGTSPAFSLHTEHPSGHDYAEYLSAMADSYELRVRGNTEVLSVNPLSSSSSSSGGGGKKKNGASGFQVEMKNNVNPDAETETLSARYVIWAAGEFQYPQEPKEENKDNSGGSDLPGSELCMHNSKVDSWATLPGDDFVVIGGYESGVDAAVNLAQAGKKCRVLASTPCWDVKTDDPSYELAPYTADRLRFVTSPGFSPQPNLFAPLRVVSVEKKSSDSQGDEEQQQPEDDGYLVTATWKELEAAYHAPLRERVAEDDRPPLGEPGSTIVFHTPNPPILCTGFAGSVKAGVARHLFEFADNNDASGCLAGAPLLTDNDESTKVPGIFLVGPAVQHDGLSFCFVYKFRQRFAVVADAICQGLGVNTKEAVAECRAVNMYLKKFDCCEDTCGDVC